MRSRHVLPPVWRFLAGVPLVVVGALAACSGATNFTAPPASRSGTAVAAVVVTPSATSLPVGASVPLRAEAHDAAGGIVAGTTIFWSSSDTTIATVSSAGVATARGIGTARIAASAGGTSAVATITVVPVPVASVAVVPGSGTVSVGSTMGLTAVAYDSAGGTLAGRSVTWASGSPAVATVDSKGVVTGVTAGTAQITATVEGRSGSATVTVARVPVASVAVSPGALALTVGQAASLVATASDAAGNVLPGRGVSWSSANTGVATVAGSGLVTAVGVGTTTVTATSEGKAATVQVVVAAAPVAPPPPPAPVAAVAITPANASVTVGGGVTLSATTTDAHGNVLTGRTITWVSSAPQIATVDAQGTVRGVAPGSATITAASEGTAATAQITVNAPPPAPPAPVATVSVTPSSATLVVGSSATLTATLRDAAGSVLAGRTTSWVTSDASVATVSAAGVVTAVAPGRATVTAVSEGKNGQAQITVNAPAPAPVASVAVTPASATLTPGGSVALAAGVFDAAHNALTGRAVTWTSSAPAVATVDASGTVTALAQGTATITATSEGKSATAQITVNPPPPAPVASVTVTPATSTLVVGRTVTLEAVTRDASGNVLTGRTVTWTSSAPGIATVSSSGIVTGVAPGTATITATSEGHSGSASVTVTAVPAASVSVTPTSLSLIAGDSGALRAVVRDANGNVLTGRPVAWTSSDSRVAAVSGTGQVSALAQGTATITATSGSASGTATVTVTAPPPPPPSVDRVVISPNSLRVQAGDHRDVTATVYDNTGARLSGQSIVWSSTDDRVVSVQATGPSTARVYARRTGNVTITATAGGKQGTLTVVVTGGD